MNLVIVESPTKAKTISKFLGKNFLVKSSYGHVRDLPESTVGVDVQKNFQPRYVINPNASRTVAELKKASKKAKTIYFATDEDREGEAISWHLAEILKPKSEQIKRIAFHEITEEAIQEALRKPRSINLNLVNAQQARRILDRLVGYELSPFLWKKVAKGLSAGRVQSVAVRLLVEREREILGFKPQEYWTIDAIFLKNNEKLTAKLSKLNNKTLDKFAVKTENEAKKILQTLDGAEYRVFNLIEKEEKRQPPAPFTTSTLQQAANHQLGFSAKQTMMFSQQLYEGITLGAAGSTGLITYMRTDSVNLAEKFLQEARAFITKEFGQKYLPTKARRFRAKSKLAQEAHEAIRPTNIKHAPQEIQEYLTPEQYKLYHLIWSRALACQMQETKIKVTTAEIIASSPRLAIPALFRASGSVIQFDGFLKILETDTKETILPVLQKNEILDLEKLLPEQHFTQPPSRFSDATLVKTLEEYGIGRPSTYAPTIGTIIERNYAQRIDNRRLQPTEIAFIVTDLLGKHFANIIDYQFTAKMEDDLDEIARGKKEWTNTLQEFYTPFKQNLAQKYQEVQKQAAMPSTAEKCEKCGKPMVIRFSKFGQFLACSGFPACRNIKKTPAPQISTGVVCPQCGKGEIVERRTKRGRVFYACNQYPACKFILNQKPTPQRS